MAGRRASGVNFLALFQKASMKLPYIPPKKHAAIIFRVIFRTFHTDADIINVQWGESSFLNSCAVYFLLHIYLIYLNI